MIPALKRIVVAVVLGLGLLALAIFVLVHILGDRPALYQGRPAYYWLGQLKSPESGVSNQAWVVVDRQLIPRLTQAMFCDTNDSRLRLALVEELNGLPGVQITFTPAEGRRAEAASALGEIGPGAKSVIPELIEALKGKDPCVRESAARALGQIHSEPEMVIPLLISFLDDPQDGVPEAVAESLGDFGALSKAAVPKLIQMLASPDRDLRHSARVALKEIDPAEAVKAGVE